MTQNLRIVICGVPPGVKVGVYDLSKSRGDPGRPLMLAEATSDDYKVEAPLSEEHVGKTVMVVVRSAGFIPLALECKIDSEVGLYRPVRLEIDRVYNGNKSEVPLGWDSEVEFERAYQNIQKHVRQVPVS